MLSPFNDTKLKTKKLLSRPPLTSVKKRTFKIEDCASGCKDFPEDESDNIFFREGMEQLEDKENVTPNKAIKLAPVDQYESCFEPFKKQHSRKNSNNFGIQLPHIRKRSMGSIENSSTKGNCSIF
jgi:hypothetical protein